jgi:hypothetical protein
MLVLTMTLTMTRLLWHDDLGAWCPPLLADPQPIRGGRGMFSAFLDRLTKAYRKRIIRLSENTKRGGPMRGQEARYPLCRVEFDDGVYRIVPEGTEFIRRGYFHAMTYDTADAAQLVCDQANALIAEGYRDRVRADQMWLAKELLRIEAPDGDGWIQVVDYRALDGAGLLFSRVAVEVPRRDVVVFGLEWLKTFPVGQDDAALAHAHALAAQGIYATGKPLTAEQFREIEWAEGNPEADANYLWRKTHPGAEGR